MKKKSKSTVTIELSKDEIPFLNAALNLSLVLEEWCAEGTFCDFGTVDAYTHQWQKNIKILINKVFNQTKIYSRRVGEASPINVNVLHEALIVEFRKWEERREDSKMRGNHAPLYDE